MDDIAGNIRAVQERVGAALERSGRGGERVTVVAVTKTFPASMIHDVIAGGIADIGENRVQEMIAKVKAVSEPCRWHLVGPLQSNKARKVVGVAHLLHAIDGVAIAQTVDRIAGEQGNRARVLLEVNTSGEATKHGVDASEAPGIADTLAELANLDWLGLMTIGPLGGDDSTTRSCFRRLARLAADLRARTGLALPELSMGMSDDFEMAIEEGSTMVRLGRVITGSRN